MDRRKRYKQRAIKLIGFKAFRDTDKDIIDWWEGLPPNQASEILRTLIRDRIAAEGDDNLTLREVQALRVDMLNQFRALAHQLRGATFAAPESADKQQSAEHLSAAEAKAREQAILERKW